MGVTRHIETNNNSVKYILGFSQEIYSMALKYKSSNNESCRRASENIINLDLNIQVTKEIHRTMVAALHKMAEVRKGFYCILCDARTQSKLSDFWNSTNFFNRVAPNPRIKYTTTRPSARPWCRTRSAHPTSLCTT